MQSLQLEDSHLAPIRRCNLAWWMDRLHCRRISFGAIRTHNDSHRDGLWAIDRPAWRAHNWDCLDEGKVPTL